MRKGAGHDAILPILRNLVYGDSCYYEIKRTCLNYDRCKRPNKCKHFELNPIDALGENPKEYKPREKRDAWEQMKII